MESDRNFESMLKELAAASRSVREGQVGAREVAVKAVRVVERALIKQLAGGSLRGLKNLGHNQDTLYAARIRGRPDGHVRWPAEPNATSESLVLLPNGRLQVAICQTDERGDMYELELRDVNDEDVHAEDLENLLRTLVEIIPRTVVYAEKACARYAGLRALSIDALKLLTGAVDE